MTPMERARALVNSWLPQPVTAKAATALAEAIETAIREAVAAERGAYQKPPLGWTCFHCGETFTTVGAARDHFGHDPLADPACRIKAGEERGLVMALRRVEAELDRYRAEDSDADRAMAAMRAGHARALIREEERGYERGLRDGLNEAAERAFAREGK